MIWGLESGEEPTNRIRMDSPSHASTSPPPRKVAIRTTQAQVPPRFQRTEEPQTQRIGSHNTTKIPKQVSQYLATERQQPQVHKPTSHADIDLSIPGHGPIDLSNVLRPRMISVEPRSQSGFHSDLQSRRPEPIIYGYDEVGNDWQNSLLAHDRFRFQSVPSSSSVSTDLSGYLTPSVSSSSMSSLQSLASSRSSIVLDQLNKALPPNIGQHAPHRMSALEIAQNYRQQQIHQTTLPTPPNSSSPLWASHLSPYQGALVSPDLLALSNLPVAPEKHINSPNYQLCDFPHNTIQLLPSDTSPVIDLNTLKAQLNGSALAPAAHIQDPILRIQDLSSSARLRTSSIPDTLGGHLRVQKQALAILSNTTGVHSPVPPRPPTNLPSAAASLPRGLHSQDGGYMRKNTVVEVPPSPTSPSNAGVRNIPHQKARSVPLSRLLSRRLSSVPEEDTNTYAGPSRCSSPGHPVNLRSHNFPIGQASKQSRSCLALRAPSPNCGPYGHKNVVQDPRRNRHLGIDIAAARSSQVAHKVHAADTPAGVVPSRGRLMYEQQANSDSSGKVTRGGVRGNRGRGGNRGKRGHSRTPSTATRNGPERVDGGLTVRS